MKVLLTIPDLRAANGGPPVVVTQLAAALLAAGDEVHLMYAAHPSSLELAIPAGVQGHAVPTRGNPWARYQQFKQKAAQVISAGRIDVVHDHGLWLPENAGSAAAAQSAALPWVAQPCGMLQAWSLRQSALKKRIAWQLYQKRQIAAAVAVVTTSAAESDEAAAWLPSTLPVECIPHGVELPTLAEGARRRQAVFLGRLHPKKQVDVLLRAWVALRPVGWQLLIAGSGAPEYERELKAQAEQAGLGNAVRFLGAVHGAEKSQLLSESQLFLQPSQQENFGLAVAEALAHGLPTLTTTAMPWAELVPAGCGWSVAADEVAITDALRQALAFDADVLLVMGRRARQFAERYSWAETARRTQQLYARVLH